KVIQLLDIQQIAFTVYQYPVSYVELVGTVFGLVAVWLATRQHILTWGLGLVNIGCFFAIFYQVQLYADMLLQVYYLITNLYGWFTWHKQQQAHQPLAMLTHLFRLRLAVGILVGSGLMGWAVAHLHLLLPDVFIQPAAFPYAGAFIAVASMAATWLLARRVVENWAIWIAVNVVCIYVYVQQGIILIAIEYVLFLALATYGLYAWAVMHQKTKQTPSV
ncbi:MAG TPA: nicotinamide riboside transporter PnuC, partial [Microscillaceae bacterium]|nr:nicotinamide riboside transporter PnuC [Microscillaceae bacterium]